MNQVHAGLRCFIERLLNCCYCAHRNRCHHERHVGSPTNFHRVPPFGRRSSVLQPGYKLPRPACTTFRRISLIHLFDASCESISIFTSSYCLLRPTKLRIHRLGARVKTIFQIYTLPISFAAFACYLRSSGRNNKFPAAWLAFQYVSKSVSACGVFAGAACPAWSFSFRPWHEAHTRTSPG